MIESEKIICQFNKYMCLGMLFIWTPAMPTVLQTTAATEKFFSFEFEHALADGDCLY